MFTVESNMGSRTYRPVVTATNEAHAVAQFSAVLDKMRPTESARLMRDGVLMARKTPKGSFFSPEWTERLGR